MSRLILGFDAISVLGRNHSDLSLKKTDVPCRPLKRSSAVPLTYGSHCQSNEFRSPHSD
jgi:hypothetical protein